MAAPVKLNFKIYQGATFRQVLRWESSTKVYVPISEISKSAPVVITAENHNCPLGWRARVTGAGGMKEINSAEYQTVTEVTQNTVSFNLINSLAYSAYTTGGVLEYNAPIPLIGYTGRMQVRTRLDSPDILLELTSENSGVLIDTELNTITLTASALETVTLDFTQAVYSFELVRGTEVVPFAAGSVSLIREVTR